MMSSNSNRVQKMRKGKYNEYATHDKGKRNKPNRGKEQRNSEPELC